MAASSRVEIGVDEEFGGSAFLGGDAQTGRRPLNAIRLLESEQPLIRRIVSWISARHGMSPDESEEFAAEIQLRLLENDCAVLKKFKGESSLKTYLTVVLQRLALDFRRRKWGSWRPSAAAKRLGADAVRLERLVYRDGYDFSEAVETLQAQFGVTADAEELEHLYAKLPSRVPRRFEGEESLLDRATDEPNPEDRLLSQETQAGREAALTRVAALLERMEVEDRLILRLLYFREMKISAIARALNLEAKPLYRRIDNLRASLRRQLEEEGFSASHLRD